MSDGTPHKVIPRHIEPRKFAHHGTALTGSIPVEALPRLAEAVIRILSVDAHVFFELGDQRERVLIGEVNAHLERQCQRCLRPVATEVKCSLALAVVRDEEQAKQLPTRFDPWIVEEESADLYQVIEEDILLSMPFVALHDYDCVDAALYHSGPVDSDDNEVPATAPANPFGVLEQLKKPK